MMNMHQGSGSKERKWEEVFEEKLKDIQNDVDF